jgi:hypothetical protein
MKLTTSCCYEPISEPWEAYDDDTLDVCSDPECNCRKHFVRAFGATEYEAVYNFVTEVLDRANVSVTELMRRSAE